MVEKALATERNYVSDVEKIAALAYDAAREAGRPLPLLDDIKEAISIVLPSPAATKPAAPVLPASKPPARALQPASRRESAPDALPPSGIAFESEQPEEQLIGGD